MEQIIFSGKLIGMLEDFVCNDMVLCLDGGKISEIKRRDQFTPVNGVPILDWSNYSVMPGLINSHDHLGFNLGHEEEQAHDHDFINVLRGIANAKTAFESGYTTMRTMGEKNFMDIYWKRAIDAGWFVGPRLVNSCQMITKTGGHGWFLGVEADGVDGLRMAIRKQVKAGADVIKIMITGAAAGGKGTEGGAEISERNTSEFSNEEIVAAIEEAHRCQRKIGAHAHGGIGTKAAIEHGMDSIEHGSYLTEDEIKLMADRGTYLVVTYGVMVAGSKLPNIFESTRKRFKEVITRYPKTIGLAKKHGVKVAFGGDTAHAGPKIELAALIEGGFTHEEALKAGTIWAAELLGMKDSIGSIEVGKLADLIAVDGDPMKHIEDIEKIAAVVKEGNILYGN